MAKDKYLKVTKSVYYVIPMVNDKISEINGWELDQVKEDWFGKNLRNHATRDFHHIANVDQIIKVEELDEKDFNKEMKENSNPKDKLLVNWEENREKQFDKIEEKIKEMKKCIK
jgi:hypothetical protein